MIHQPIQQIEIADHRRLRSRDQADLLKELVGLCATPERIVSLHLDCEWNDEQQRERARLFVKHQASRLAKAAPELDAELEHAIEFSEGLIARRFDEQYAGMAAFFCAPLDLDLVVRLHRPLEPRLHIASRPLVGPIVRALSDAPPILVAVASREDTRVWTYVASAPSAQDVIAREVPNRHSRGGWSQLRWQKHVDQHARDQLKEAAAAIARRFDDFAGSPFVVLAGPVQAMETLADLLPERLHVRLLRVDGVGRYDGDDRIFERAQACVTERLLQEREHDAQVAIDAARGGGRGVVGPAQVAQAANHKRIERLLLHDQMRAEGSRCDECGELCIGPVELCPSCENEMEPVRLEDALPEAAVMLSAPVEMVHGESVLERVGHCAALLRY
jgi:peptide chain release factor subunit 1